MLFKSISEKSPIEIITEPLECLSKTALKICIHYLK